MKNLKKLTALTLAFIFALALGIAKPQRVQAADYTDSQGVVYTCRRDEATVIGYSGSGGAITIPSEVTDPNDSTKKYTVTAIGDSAFRENKSLTSITIPKSVESIGFCAFFDCTNLGSVTFEENSKLTSIGGYAFRNCTGLTSISIPESVEELDESAFDECTSLTAITVDNYNKKYSSVDGVLYNYYKTKLIICPRGKKSITIPNSVESIGRTEFNGCTSLQTVTFEDNSKLTSIEEFAFQNCNDLESISIPKSVESIGQNAFYNCASLKTIYFDGTEEQWKNISKSAGIGSGVIVKKAPKFLTFHANGHGTAPESQKVYSGDVTTAPTEDITETGWIFGGWYTNKDCTDGNEFNFGNALMADTIVYAKWTPYKVTAKPDNAANVEGNTPSTEISLEGKTEYKIEEVFKAAKNKILMYIKIKEANGEQVNGAEITKDTELQISNVITNIKSNIELIFHY